MKASAHIETRRMPAQIKRACYLLSIISVGLEALGSGMHDLMKRACARLTLALPCCAGLCAPGVRGQAAGAASGGGCLRSDVSGGCKAGEEHGTLCYRVAEE